MVNKSEAVKACQDVIDEKITGLEASINELQESANQETKSSMGDKYETGRAMNQNAKALLQFQLSEVLKSKQVIKKVASMGSVNNVNFGAFVELSTGYFLVGVPLGKMKIKSIQFMAISVAAPIAQAMIGKKAGESFLWNGASIEVKSIA